MGWKKILLIILLTLGFIFLILLAVFEPGKSAYYTYQAKEMGDLSYCNKIPFFKIYIHVSESIIGSPNINVGTQRELCRRVLRFFDSEEHLEVYARAIRENNPELCLTLPNFFTTPISKNSIACITEINERYMDESICEYYTEIQQDKENIYLRYSREFNCRSKIAISKEQDVSFCENYGADLRDYCYFSFVSTYNSLRRVNDFLVVDIPGLPGEEDLFKPIPEVPYVCDKIIEESKSSCINSYKEFEKSKTL